MRNPANAEWMSASSGCYNRPLNIMIPVEHKLKSLWDLGSRWHDDALEFLRSSAPRIIVVIVVAFILVKLLRIVTRRLTAFTRTQALPSGVRAQQLRTLASVINGVGMFVIFFVALMQVLEVVQINIGPLLASAGVAGLAIGFGAQTLVKDVINGFFILMENQYDVGDIVKISGVSGTVEHLTLRRTVLRDADGALHNVPNSEIKSIVGERSFGSIIFQKKSVKQHLLDAAGQFSFVKDMLVMDAYDCIPELLEKMRGFC
jgi:small conductance mechanosensitive channel